MVNLINEFFPYIWPKGRADIKSRIILSLIILIFAKILTVLIPYTYKWATDALVGENTTPPIIPIAVFTPIILIIAFGLGRILMVAFNQLRDVVFAKVGQNAVRQLGSVSFSHLHNLSLRFHLDRRTGALNRVVERGIKGIENIVRLAILNTVPTIFEFIFVGLILLIQFDWRYLLVVTLTIISYSYFTIKYSSLRVVFRQRMNSHDEDANNKSLDSLLNYETVKHFNNEKIEEKRFDEAMAGYEQASIKTLTSLSFLNFGQTAIFTIGLTLCMVLSGLEVKAGDQTIGDFVLINALLMQLAIPLNFFGFIYREISQGLTDLNSLFSILKIKPEINDKKHAISMKFNKAEINFKDVSFSYDGKRKVLQNLNFNIPSGSSLAIVGPTGAGKSTISRLLFRFYDVTNGNILINGQDIQDISQVSLRKNIGIVPQDTVLFNDTVFYNLKYGKISSSDKEIWKVAEQAQLSSLIKNFPDGMNTVVGERGLKLSGGEKQRVAIARTLLKNPPILILDEATSALDTLTEREIKQSLNELAEKRTTIIIAHRLSTVVDANKILVLDKGKIKEQGTHKQLLRKKGLYADMWSTQQTIKKAEATLKNVKPEYKKLLSS
jgi:ATP-binding cassette subfamily B protein